MIKAAGAEVGGICYMIEPYFQLALQAICLARISQALGLVSPYVCFRVMESVAEAPNSTYT